MFDQLTVSLKEVEQEILEQIKNGSEIGKISLYKNFFKPGTGFKIRFKITNSSEDTFEFYMLTLVDFLELIKKAEPYNLSLSNLSDKEYSEGNTLLHLACLFSDSTPNAIVQLIEELIKQGADPKIKNKYDITPLHCACEGQADIQVINILIKHGAALEATDVNGETPLFYACKHNSLGFVQELLKLNPYVTAINKYGKTPLDKARQRLDNLSQRSNVTSQGLGKNELDEAQKYLEMEQKLVQTLEEAAKKYKNEQKYCFVVLAEKLAKEFSSSRLDKSSLEKIFSYIESSPK